MDKKIKTFTVNVLRRASVRWWGKSQAYKSSFIRKEGRKHLHECAECKGEFAKKDTQADHIVPVIEPGRSIHDHTLDEIAVRLFVPASGYQILCKECHIKKSGSENQIRYKTRKKGKKKNGKTSKRTKKRK